MCKVPLHSNMANNFHNPLFDNHLVSFLKPFSKTHKLLNNVLGESFEVC